MYFPTKPDTLNVLLHRDVPRWKDNAHHEVDRLLLLYLAIAKHYLDAYMCIHIAVSTSVYEYMCTYSALQISIYTRIHINQFISAYAKNS